MGIKQFIKQQTIKHAPLLTGYVVNVDDDGTLNINLKGRKNLSGDPLILKVYNNSSYDVTSGSTVTLCRIEGDVQKYTILGAGAYSGSDESEIVSL